MKVIHERSVSMMKQVYVLLRDEINMMKDKVQGIKVILPKVDEMIYDSHSVLVSLIQTEEGNLE